MRILHVLDHSLPMLDGYAVRSKHIVEGQRAAGLDVAAVTAYMPQVAVPPEEEINGVRYYRTLPGNPKCFAAWLPLMRQKLRQRWLDERLREAAEEFRPDLIHSHSPVLYGVRAQVQAARRGIPFVYEVRAFWEDAASEQGKFGERSIRYRLLRRMETRLFRKAAAVVAISQRLCDEIVGRGIAKEKVVLAPNGVDTALFAPRARNEELAERLGLAGRVVIGYLGSFFGFEGVQVLIRAAGAITQQAPDASVLIVGGGRHEEAVRREADAAGLPKDRLLLTGRVPFEEVIDYYSIMDVLVYPRLSHRLTELVTPLKPLEAMSMGKAVAGSSVGGIEELIQHSRTGLLFEPGNPGALAEACIRLAGDPGLRGKLGAGAREYIDAKRRWPDIIPRYIELYERLLRVR